MKLHMIKFSFDITDTQMMHGGRIFEGMWSGKSYSKWI